MNTSISTARRACALAGSLLLLAAASCGDSNQRAVPGAAGGTNSGGSAGSSATGHGGGGGSSAPEVGGNAGGSVIGGFGGSAGAAPPAAGGNTPATGGNAGANSSGGGAGGYAGGPGPWSHLSPPPCQPTPAAPVALRANASYLLDAAPMRAYVGDLNGDGEPDLAVLAAVNLYPQTGAVYVRLNAGGGLFSDDTAYPVAELPSAMAAGDLDGDGDTDLVVATSFSQYDDSSNPVHVSVLLNAGDGTFAPGIVYPTGRNRAVGIALGDVDDDGDLDVMVSGDDTQISVLANTGQGTLQAPTTFVVPSIPSVLAAGDLDGDGSDDLVAAAGQGGLIVRPSALPSVSAVVLAAPADDVAVADLNSDGKLDLVAAGSTGVTVLLNQGAATFSTAGTYPAANSVVLADVTGDGRIDIVTVGTDVMTVLVNDGNGLFHDTNPDGYQPLHNPAAAGDVNGDGWIDLVSTTPSFPGSVDIALNQGGGFFPSLEAGPLGMTPQAMNVSDLDGDGDLDVVVTNEGDGTVTVLLNVGDGTFTAGQSYPAGPNPSDVAAGDLDGDGDLDLIVTSTNMVDDTSSTSQVYVLLNDGAGAFTTAATYPAALGTGEVALGDVNGDGALDFVVATEGFASTEILRPGALVLFLNAGDGTFTMTTIAPGQGAGVGAVAIGDVNGDGAPDIIPLDRVWMLNDGQGNFTSPSLGNPEPSFFYAPLTIVDLNGDGKLDVVSADSVGLNDGHGNFFLPIPYGYSPPIAYAGQPATASVGDLNGDGFPELVVNSPAGDSTVFLNDGCGAFTQGPTYAVTGKATAVADMNGDGRSDLVLLNDSGVSVILNTAP